MTYWRATTSVTESSSLVLAAVPGQCHYSSNLEGNEACSWSRGLCYTNGYLVITSLRLKAVVTMLKNSFVEPDLAFSILPPTSLASHCGCRSFHLNQSNFIRPTRKILQASANRAHSSGNIGRWRFRLSPRCVSSVSGKPKISGAIGIW